MGQSNKEFLDQAMNEFRTMLRNNSVQFWKELCNLEAKIQEIESSLKSKRLSAEELKSTSELLASVKKHKAFYDEIIKEYS